MTVLEVIQKSAEFLAKKDVEPSRLQAELLLSHALKLPRMKLYLNFERTLAPAELDAVRELVKRRSQREPLQHIVGSTSFCGLEMAVNRHVLVPRPETELLAEAGWKFMTALSTATDPSCDTKSRSSRREEAHSEERSQSLLTSAATTALDFGTGSGCIAIALAVKCPAAQITALEVSPEALTIARENAARNGVAERIYFVQGEGFAALPANTRFDLIISNPPYIPTAEIASLEPEVRDFDPRSALDGGTDGLDFYRLLAAQTAGFLQLGGKIMVEFGDGQGDEVKSIFESQKWIVEALREDYSQRQRILVARR